MLATCPPCSERSTGLPATSLHAGKVKSKMTLFRHGSGESCRQGESVNGFGVPVSGSRGCPPRWSPRRCQR